MKFSGPLPFIPQRGQYIIFHGADPILVHAVHAIAPETIEGQWESLAVAFTQHTKEKPDHMTNLSTSLFTLGFKQVEE